jgi:hypothetical protein
MFLLLQSEKTSRLDINREQILRDEINFQGLRCLNCGPSSTVDQGDSVDLIIYRSVTTEFALFVRYQSIDPRTLQLKEMRLHILHFPCTYNANRP